MKRILALIRRDLLSTTKDYILLYAVLAPLVIAIGLRFFLPSVGATTANMVMLDTTPEATVAQLREYVNVDLVPDRAALERRVLAYDDAVGMVPKGDGGYTIVVEGNESHDARVLPAMVLQKVENGGTVEIESESLAAAPFPLREVIGAFLAFTMLFIGSVVMGLHIVEDKESRVMHALGVSPLSRREYVAARALLVLVLGVFMAFASLWALGLIAFDHLQILAIAIVGSLFGAVAAFVLGALSGNQIAAIANMKFGVLLIMLPAMLTFVLPENMLVALYWAPSYWTFVAFKAVLADGASWATVGQMLVWNLAGVLVFAAAAYPWLKGRLDFARN